MPERIKEIMEKKTDEELVALSLKDQKYFLYLITRYESKLIRYIRRISSATKEDAEDILQEVFIKVYQNLNDFDLSLKFSSWIYRICHNQVISNYRKIKPVVLNEFPENIPSDSDLIREMDLKDMKKDVRRVLAELDIKYREVLILKFLEDKTYQEMSDILKKPMGTIATLINRAKKEFKEKYEQH